MKILIYFPLITERISHDTGFSTLSITVELMLLSTAKYCALINPRSDEDLN